MVNDHIGVETGLAALANGEQIDLPNGNGEEGDKVLSKMQSTQREDFDKAFTESADRRSCKRYQEVFRHRKEPGMKA